MSIPLIGMGGILNTEDALEFMLAGASAVAVGTANFIRPDVTMEIIEGMRAYVREQGLSSIREIIGTVR